MPQEMALTWPPQRQLGHGTELLQIAEGQRQSDIAAGDGGRARAAIGLDDIAIDLDLALAEAGEVGDGAQAPADQALDLMGPPALAAARRLARCPACRSPAAACRIRP